ncbi:MAG TPA: PEP-CTERM sorting domain-containing protein [Thermoguttaceae bacterium]|nr:PEP-CTERM sorting domain-containing protein [Thermoguttaceae bacterium]
MRGIILTLALLAMTSASLAGPVTLGYVAENMYVADGYKSYIVQATGGNINVMTSFSFDGSRTGDVYQVFANDLPTAWINDGNTNPAVTTDSYIIFGSDRYEGVPGPPSVVSTTETIVGGGTTSGMGTLTNLSGSDFDGYTRHAVDDYPLDLTPEVDPEVVDLFHLVVPDGAYVDVDVTLYTCDWDPEAAGGAGAWTDTQEHALSTRILCPLDGDADQNGIVNLLDLAKVANNFDKTGKAWVDGEFTGEGTVNLLDLAKVASNFDGVADWYGLTEGAAPPAGVPEPGTILMLVLGGLCLTGYRLRKS